MTRETAIYRLPLIRHLREVYHSLLSLPRLARVAERALQLQIDEFQARHLFENPKYECPKRLNRYELSVFSQNGEDGIVREIFTRIGTTNRVFVEFGVGDGIENNTLSLLALGWTGLWIECNELSVLAAQKALSPYIGPEALHIKRASVTAENIEALLMESAIPVEFDLLSIDIDLNDYWVWKAIERHSPRVVIIEYNPAFPPGMAWVAQYDAQARWDHTTHFGASLTSLQRLGDAKGYSLVACDFSGTNAFFVRSDLTAAQFQEPYTAENHYEPSRFVLADGPYRRRRRFGRALNI